MDAVGMIRYAPDEEDFEPYLFVGGELGYSRQSLHSAEVPGTTHGAVVGSTVGLVIPVRTLKFQMTANVAYVRYERRLSPDFVGLIPQEPVFMPEGNAAGLRLTARLGISIPIGG